MKEGARCSVVLLVVPSLFLPFGITCFVRHVHGGEGDGGGIRWRAATHRFHPVLPSLYTSFTFAVFLTTCFFRRILGRIDAMRTR